MGREALVLVVPLLAACHGGDPNDPNGGNGSQTWEISDQNLMGVVGGMAWEFADGQTDSFWSDENVIWLELFDEAFTACDWTPEPDGAKIFGKFPREPGEYMLGSERTITFLVPPSDNTIVFAGRIATYEVTETTLRGGMNVSFDANFEVDGTFQVEICPD